MRAGRLPRPAAAPAGALVLLLAGPRPCPAQWESDGPTRDEHDLPAQFGAAVAPLGDLDLDGTLDLAVGEPGANRGGRDRGTVRVVQVGAGGMQISRQELRRASSGIKRRLSNRDGFGFSLAALGDLDGDGTTDLAAGGPGDDSGGRNKGALWVLFLTPEATIRAQQKVSSKDGGFAGLLSRRDRFGSALAPLEDLDGDLVQDLAAGAPKDDDGRKDSGAVWILFLARDGTVARHAKVSALEGGFSGPLRRGDRFGSSLAALGDLDGDAVEDLAVGAPHDDDGAFRSGAVWILFLDPGGTVKAERKISALEGGFSGELRTRHKLGTSVACLGDLDGDGVQDLAAGAEGDIRKRHAGAVWILFLERDGTVKAERRIGSLEGGFPAELRPGDELGSSLALLGDLEGDGLLELAAGADGRFNGNLWILSLAIDGTVQAASRLRR